MPKEPISSREQISLDSCSLASDDQELTVHDSEINTSS